MKRRRLNARLTQKAAGFELGVSLFTVINCEHGYRKPAMKNWPAIVRFPGYDPLPDGQAIPERLRQKRRQMAWGPRKLAEHLGVDRFTITSWECGGTIVAKAQSNRSSRAARVQRSQCRIRPRAPCSSGLAGACRDL